MQIFFAGSCRIIHSLPAENPGEYKGQTPPNVLKRFHAERPKEREKRKHVKEETVAYV
jgi:hypothetical protein